MNKPRIVAIIQGRMSASRFPGKVLQDLAGRPMLARVFERVCRAATLDHVLVATTRDMADDPVFAFCQAQGYPVFRGEVFDVLDRFYQAARYTQADVIVRITADCPVIDPALIDLVVEEYLRAAPDFAANRLPPPWKRTFPIGLDVEACSFVALERAWQEADQKYQREHVMPYFYEGILLDAFSMTGNSLVVSPRGFRVLLVNHARNLGALRWTVDTPEDLALMQAVYNRFSGRDDFAWTDVLDLFAQEPDLAKLNAAVQHKSAFDVDSRQG